MRYHFFLHYGWFLQNLRKEALPSFMHTTVRFSICLHLKQSRKLYSFHVSGIIPKFCVSVFLKCNVQVTICLFGFVAIYFFDIRELCGWTKRCCKLGRKWKETTNSNISRMSQSWRFMLSKWYGKMCSSNSWMWSNFWASSMWFWFTLVQNEKILQNKPTCLR